MADSYIYSVLLRLSVLFVNIHKRVFSLSILTAIFQVNLG